MNLGQTILTHEYIMTLDIEVIIDIMAKLLAESRQHYLFPQQMNSCISALKEKLHEERSIPPVIEDHYSDSLPAYVTA